MEKFDISIKQLIDCVKNQNQALAQHAHAINTLMLRADLITGITNSKSQFYQDLFVLKETGYKRDGFFVEFGATNGVEGSNTFILEKMFGWSGVLAEPARCWHNELRQNRNVLIDTKCVWNASGELIEFHEDNAATLSTAKIYADADFHSRSNFKTYPVETISLLDLLEQHHAPQNIDYLSIDTEGSEYDILSAFDFEKFNIKIITCEHNWSSNRSKISELLFSKGYEVRHQNLTNCDDWFVRKPF
jgi:FkbM family methyltransferase